ncbi:hypothetical protein GCM10016455_05690 [Aliiroseovarius zhejiangensis]|uniref:Uncharacterized protein n=1 Tax=Aliiroseovarius zhejiangensis TaxID=1632025 RepID=A0ABQ3IQ22_9RHOB|nr:hypothetical protein [Aliiroseovarius zhejiangensis]GHE88418.1 hypothetical protein GCM10016455_05690 [Aliiroseovarius zhejiangensis]
MSDTKTIDPRELIKQARLYAKFGPVVMPAEHVRLITFLAEQELDVRDRKSAGSRRRYWRPEWSLLALSLLNLAGCIWWWAQWWLT